MTAAVISAALAAGIAFSPLAHADVDQYEQYMISHGMVSGAGANCAPANPNCGASLEYLLQQGKNECAAFAEGKSDQWLIGQLESGAPVNLGRAGAENIVYAAHQYL